MSSLLYVALTLAAVVSGGTLGALATLHGSRLPVEWSGPAAVSRVETAPAPTLAAEAPRTLGVLATLQGSRLLVGWSGPATVSRGEAALAPTLVAEAPR